MVKERRTLQERVLERLQSYNMQKRLFGQGVGNYASLALAIELLNAIHWECIDQNRRDLLLDETLSEKKKTKMEIIYG